jgi:hypothetical protein
MLGRNMDARNSKKNNEQMRHDVVSLWPNEFKTTQAMKWFNKSLFCYIDWEIDFNATVNFDLKIVNKTSSFREVLY